MKGLLKDLPPLWDLKGWLQAILSRKQHPVLQFLRYGIAGVAAMAANILVFAICIRWIFPIPPESPSGLEPFPSDIMKVGSWLIDMARDVRVANFVKSNAVAFVLANTVAYVMNFKWVFQSGRHSRQMEVLLFFSLSLFSFVIGTSVASLMVGTFGVNEYIAKGSDVVFAILINFICRKFLVFKIESG